VKYEVELQYSVEARDGRTMFVRRVACSFPVFPGLELVVADEFHLVERVQYAPESGELIIYLCQNEIHRKFTLDWLRRRFLADCWEEDLECLELYSEQEQS
jgi:hypothetical protein